MNNSYLNKHGKKNKIFNKRILNLSSFKRINRRSDDVELTKYWNLILKIKNKV